MTSRLSPFGVLLAACCLAGCASPTGAAAGATATATASTAVLATANGLSLTRDDAEAFIDAFQFSLEQIGRPKTFTAAEREELIKGLAQNFPKQPAAAQQAVVKARATWTATKAAWATTDPLEQQSFVDGVLAIAVGEDGAAQLTGRGGTGAAGGGDAWADEAKDKCENGNFDDQMFYCHGVITPSVPW